MRSEISEAGEKSVELLGETFRGRGGGFFESLHGLNNIAIKRIQGAFKLRIRRPEYMRVFEARDEMGNANVAETIRR